MPRTSRVAPRQIPMKMERPMMARMTRSTLLKVEEIMLRLHRRVGVLALSLNNEQILQYVQEGLRTFPQKNRALGIWEQRRI